MLDLSLNALPPHPFRASLAARTDDTAGVAPESLLDYPPRAGVESHREAGAAWFRRRGLAVDASDVLVTVGAQHALLVAMSAAGRPGDAVLVEEITYGGVLGAAHLLGLSPVAVAIDAHGLRADALDAAAVASGARVVVVQPTIHNPTGVAMTAARRQAVLGVAARRGLTVIEDDTYGFLDADTRPLVAEGVPSRACVTGLSKSLAGGYRAGFLTVSRDLFERAQAALWGSVVSASPISVARAVALIHDGTADAIVEWKRAEVRARLELARRILPQLPEGTSPVSPHVWLPLSRPWRASAFADAARARGIIVSATEGFLPHPGATPRAVRVCLMPPRSRERLAEALGTLAELAGRPPDLPPTL